MSASRPGNMRGPRVKTPLLLLLLLLTGTVLCKYEEDAEIGDREVGDDGNPETSVPSTVSETTSTPELPTTVTSDSENQETEENDPTSLTPTPEEKGSGDGSSGNSAAEGDNLVYIIILIPVVLVVVIIGMIVCCIFINRRWNKKGRNQELRQEDPYLDGSSTEKVPMPMFEEDVPSVLELEMEELDQWMKKDG